jgi:hypothetical protein
MELNKRSGWSDVTVQEFQELYEIERDQPVDYLTERLSILLDIDVDSEEFQSQDVDVLFDLIKEYNWLDSQPAENVKQSIKFNDIKLQLKPVNSLTINEFIDLGRLCENPIQNLHQIAAVLFKQYKTNDWGHEIEEPYSYDLEKRATLFLELPVTYVYGLIQIYNNWKDMIHHQYSHIFIDPEDLEDDFDRTGLDEDEQQDIERALEQEKRESNWAWEFLLLNVTQDRFEQIETVLNMTVIFFFNMYSVKQYRDKKQAKD